MGGEREAPELAKNWSSGQRTKVSERAPQLGGEAGPGSPPRLGCSGPPSCARDRAGRRRPPPPPHYHDAGSALHRWLTRKHVHRQRKGKETIRGQDSGPCVPCVPWSPEAVVGVTPPAPPSHEPGTGEGALLPAARSRPAPSAREDQSPQSRARRMLPPRSPERVPPDTLRQRAGAVISALLGPRGTRKEEKDEGRLRDPEPVAWGSRCLV
ncbi:scavenger receptor class F member 2-like [Saccopteryx leptura]|uniref:scavenger receptor class F member 2-like n=1 Tax=Saccopteryx leptura TaxID=249018 RepID=UPI00339BDCCE